MKNKLSLFLIISVLAVLPAVSFAQTAVQPETPGNGGTKGTIRTIKDEIEAKREAIKQNVASKTDAIKESVEARRQNALNKIIDRIGQFVANIITRYDAAVNRLEILSNRIDSRIAKTEEQKIDVTKAKELLANAKAKIEIAKTSTLNITGNIASSTASSTAELKKEYEIVKTEMGKAKEDIKTAHAALVDVVNSLKPGNNKTKDASTTSTGPEQSDEN
jgi:hypothetical protein